MPYGRPVAGVCVATALFACGASGFPNAPAQLPPASAQLSLAGGSATVAPGARLSLSGGGFVADAAVTIAIYSSPNVLDHVVADAHGNVSATVTLPSSLRGEHTVTALGNSPTDSARVLTAAVDIEAATGSSSSLAQTGFSVMEWILGGLALLIAGFAFLRTAAFGRRLRPARQ